MNASIILKYSSFLVLITIPLALNGINILVTALIIAGRNVIVNSILAL